MLEIIPIPAFQDNYIWLLKRDGHATVVDPGDATPVLAVLKAQNLTLDSILITHHHNDHIGGVAALLLEQQVGIYAPKRENYSFPHQAVSEGDTVTLEHLQLQLRVLELPGHTLGHVAYYGANCLFCGDTLFGAGCGRLFEGTPAQMQHSLQRLAQLPEKTAVYCTHEYTEHNLRFAMTLEPGNPQLRQRQLDTAAIRAANKPSLPSTIALELATNPFLRCDQPEIRRNAGVDSIDPLAVFSAIREMRNHY